MTDAAGNPTAPPVSAAARVVLIGEPSPLRAAVALRLHTAAALLACLDTPAHSAPALSSAAASSGAGLSGATIMLVTAPRPPGLATSLRHRFGAPALGGDFERTVMDAREHGAARVVVLSTVFRYDDDRGLPLQPDWPTLTAAETAPAAAAEQAARLFAELGGDSVVLRLGWTFSGGEAITRQVVSAARRGWRLIDGDPAAWVAMITESDAARAVLPALTVTPGTYNVTDGCPITQGMLNTRLETALGRDLHSLDDPHWGYNGTLFGPSRKIADVAFGHLTGWRPHHVPAVESPAGLLSIHPDRLELPAACWAHFPVPAVMAAVRGLNGGMSIRCCRMTLGSVAIARDCQAQARSLEGTGRA
jgi:hypothetical protein